MKEAWTLEVILAINLKLEYDDLENIKTDCVNAVVFNLHQIKHFKFFLGHPVLESISTYDVGLLWMSNMHKLPGLWSQGTLHQHCIE